MCGQIKFIYERDILKLVKSNPAIFSVKDKHLKPNEVPSLQFLISILI